MIWVAFETIKILLETKNIISVTIVVIYIIKDCKINKIIEYMSWSFIVVNLFSALYPKMLILDVCDCDSCRSVCPFLDKKGQNNWTWNLSLPICPVECGSRTFFWWCKAIQSKVLIVKLPELLGDKCSHLPSLKSNCSNWQLKHQTNNKLSPFILNVHSLPSVKGSRLPCGPRTRLRNSCNCNQLGNAAGSAPLARGHWPRPLGADTERCYIA